MISQSKWKLLPLWFLVMICISGCESLSYYSQSIVGHSQLMLARQPIDKAIASAEEDEKQILETAKVMREFAKNELDLPDNNSYLSFVNLDRSYPVWTVVATPEFSLNPVNWCFPIVGCTSYRGYFSEKNAMIFEKKMQSQGFETIVGGAPAYSTLGWFSDPLIPSMYKYGEITLAEIMFHELAHQQFYVKNNSAYNEAFATVVGEQGALKWLKKNSPDKVQSYLQLLKVRNDFSSLIKDTKLQLQNLYKRSLSESSMRQQKDHLFDTLYEEYLNLRSREWGDKAWYQSWFKEKVNNAKLAAFSTYRDLVPEFEKLLVSCNEDFQLFYLQVEKQKNKGSKAKVPKHC